MAAASSPCGPPNCSSIRVERRGSGSDTRTVYIRRLLCMYMVVHLYFLGFSALGRDAGGFVELQKRPDQARRVVGDPPRHSLLLFLDSAADRRSGGVAAGLRGRDQDLVGGDFHVLEGVACQRALDHFV